VYWRSDHGGKMTFDRLRERELFTPSEVVQERMCAGEQPHGACLPGITPGCTNDCLELRPLGGLKVLVTPLLELRGGRLRARGLAPGGAGCVVLRRGGVAQLRMHPAAHDRHVFLGNLVQRSCHTLLPLVSIP
jgi:hypothetical protein